MSKKLSLQHAAVAYLLNKELGYNQSRIGDLMGVSQGTISSSIKDFEYQMQIRSLQKELDRAYEMIKSNNLLPDFENFIVN